MLSLKFPVTMATREHLKLPKNHYFVLIFFHQNWFQSAATSQSIQLSQRLFSVGYTLPYDRSGSFLASHKSKIFLATTSLPLFNPPSPKQKGAHPPWFTFMMGVAPKTCSIFYKHFSNEIRCVTIWGLKEGGGRKCVISRIYEVKG
jgi:hypothetical protein